MEKKQTAVEWLANQLGITSGTMLEQALNMEEQQSSIAYLDGYSDGFDAYNEQTYGSSEKPNNQ